MFNWKKWFGQQEPVPIWKVLQHLRRTIPDSWLKQAVCLTTPFAQKVALSESGLSAAMLDFISRYEPQAARQGIFIHQQQVLQASLTGHSHILLTSSTGSGKSLCFWAWVADKLANDPRATAIVCFPTQALLWGQTVRLQEISDDCSISGQGLALSGRLMIAGQSIAWTVWKGSGANDPVMAAHEQTAAFKQARLRIATIDKVHYSLLSRDGQFAARLSCIVLDEAHQYQGVFGAQAAYLLKRIAVLKAALDQLPPRVFLASATLPHARAFAAKLLAVSPEEILHQKDSIQTSVTTVDWKEAEEQLHHPPQSALLRVAVFYDKQPQRPALDTLLLDRTLTQCSSVYFSPSKYSSRLLKRKLAQRGSAAQALIYDADLPLAERRRIEQEFRQPRRSAITLIATTALELGVDIEGLEVCLIPEIPANQADLLQRIGRVGRRQGRPGLILVNLTSSLNDEPKRRHLAELFGVDSGREPFLPLNLEWIHLKSLAAVYQELQQARTQLRGLTAQRCQRAIERLYVGSQSLRDIKRRLIEICGGLDFSCANWQYAGFRGGSGQGKVMLVDQATGQPVALIGRLSVLRDAPLGGRYLDHRDQSWQVVSYNLRTGEKEPVQVQSPAQASHLWIDAAKIRQIVVVRAQRDWLTRGICRCDCDLLQALRVPFFVPDPLVYGRWRVRQQLAGYRQVRFDESGVTIVKLPNHHRVYQDFVTLGWVWQLPRVTTRQQDLCLREMTEFFQQIFASFLLQQAGVASRDLFVDFSARRQQLRVMDAEPGGNGIAAELLKQGVRRALEDCCGLVSDCVQHRQLATGTAEILAQISHLSLAVDMLRQFSRQWNSI